MIIGLSVRLWGDMLGATTRDVVGDALWASMILWWISVLIPRANMYVRGGVAYAICVAVEFSQLVHTPWLESARETLIGQLALGSGFDIRDLAAYAFGVAVAAGLSKKLVAPVVIPRG